MSSDAPSSSYPISTEDRVYSEHSALLHGELKQFTSTEQLRLRGGCEHDITDAYFYTIRGVENLLIYTWIAKDLCWLTYFKYYLPFPIAALSISGLLVLNSAVIEQDFEDVWHRIAEFLWLLANFFWMQVSSYLTLSLCLSLSLSLSVFLTNLLTYLIV